jgi:Zn-dependent peptidase ImmA (M78 family)
MAAGVDALVAQMRETLKVKLEDFRKQKTLGDAFALLRSAAERAGVFVLLMGNLGTYHTDLPPRVFRGFAIADNIAPFVVINETDARAAWSFTLLHELAHIWLGQTGVSGYEGEAAVEKFCDAVAARFLLSADEVGAFKISNGMSFNDLRGALEDFAIERNVSRKMVAYNFLQAGKINLQMYRRLSDAFDAARTAMEKAQPKGDSSGPDYYVVRRHRVGAALLDFASRMLASGVLNTTKASKVLGVKPTSVDQLISAKRAA